MMRDAGAPQFSKESFIQDFKMLNDKDPASKQIKDLIKFDPAGITVKKPGEQDTSSTGDAKTVNQMAKRATKIGS